MASNESVVNVKDGYKILRKNKDGTEKTVAEVHTIARMEDAKAIPMFLGFISKEGDKQIAALSLLCSIMDNAKAAAIDMEQFRGTGDKKKGQLSEGIKDTFRKCEDAYFDAFLKPEHPEHKAYTKGLPKVNVDNEPLPDAIGERHAYAKTRMRKDPSYGNAKNLALNLWHFCGTHLYDSERGSIIPPAVMRVMVNNAKEVDNTAPTFAERLSQQLRELFMPADPKNPPAIGDKELATLKQDLARALEAVTERLNEAAVRATKAAELRKPSDVKGEADAAIGEAKDKQPA